MNEGYAGLPNYFSTVLVDVGKGHPLAAEFYAFPCFHTREQAFNPFTPVDGYQVGAEDLATTTRKEKIVRLATIPTSSAITTAPLHFSASIEAETLVRAGLADPVPGRPQQAILREDALALLTRLRLQLTFPTHLTYEARPDALPFRQSGGLVFSNVFYPLDTAGLAAITDLMVDEGAQLALPAGADQLQQVLGRFVLAPETRRRHACYGNPVPRFE